MLFKLFH